MLLLQPMDPSFPIGQQLTLAAAPVVLVNIFRLAPEDEECFLAIWKDDAAFMMAQPGFISTQLHRALGPNPTYLNYAVWETNADFRSAFSHPEFQNKLVAYPSSAVAMPHLFQKVTVNGICVA